MQLRDVQPAPPLRIPMPPLSRRAFGEWWLADSGYRQVLQLAWPLFLAQGSSTILQFIDRMFLTWYSPAAMAAAGPSGMLAFTLQALFLGLTGYASVFVAQYTGAGKPRQALASVWQAVYLALFASLIMLFLAPIGGHIFAWVGHEPAVQQMERAFFTIFLNGSFLFIGGSALGAYFIGRGMTRVVLGLSLIAVSVNIILDYLLIFGKFGFPEMGITGAALASVIAQGVGLLLGVVIFLREARRTGEHGAWRPDFHLMGRLLRYGTANGVQFMLDMVSWTAFLLLVGRLGATALGATNLAFQLNGLAFFPIIGFGMATSTLVGQNLGKDRPDLANRAVWSAIHISLVFTACVGLIYVTLPGWLLAPFSANANPAEFAPVRELTIFMLRFVAAYCLFDVGNLILSSALKGAGDILYVMLLSTGLCVLLMLVPTYFCVQPGGWGVLGAWGFVTFTVCILSAAFLLRYLKGHWRDMRVIEHEVID